MWLDAANCAYYLYISYWNQCYFLQEKWKSFNQSFYKILERTKL